MTAKFEHRIRGEEPQPRLKILTSSLEIDEEGTLRLFINYYGVIRISNQGVITCPSGRPDIGLPLDSQGRMFRVAKEVDPSV